MQGILAVFPVNTKLANKTFQNSVATVQYTLIEHSASWQVFLKFSALEMHVLGLSSYSGNSNLMSLWRIMEHNWVQWRKSLEHC